MACWFIVYIDLLYTLIYGTFIYGTMIYGMFIYAGYEGDRCENVIDSCRDVQCDAGTCVNGQCQCPPGKTGSKCDKGTKAMCTSEQIIDEDRPSTSFYWSPLKVKVHEDYS